jgi:hypothetical protein
MREWHLLKQYTTICIVIPAKAGIQALKKHRPTARFWMPVPDLHPAGAGCAGMTAFFAGVALR